MDPKLSIYQCGLRKNSAQNCILFLLAKWRKCVGSSRVLLTDLSKAFDCLVHDLLIAKLNAYGFDYSSLKLIYNYLTDRLQRVKVNSSYSSCSKIIYGVPQESILGPLLFNIYLNELFMSYNANISNISNIANYADTSSFSCSKDIDSVITQLEGDSKILN